MKRPLLTLGLLAVTGLVCASCSSSSKTTTSGTSTSADTTTSSTAAHPSALASSSAAASSSAPTSSSAPSSGKADPSKTAVAVGFENLEGGPIFSLPNTREGFEAGIDYVNAELGGVNGHPLKAVECKSAGTPDAAVNCGNQFVQNKVVLSVLGTDFSADAILPVLKSANIVMLGPEALTPGVNSAIGYAFMDYYPAQEGYAANLSNAKAAGATNVAEVYPDQPAQHALYSTVIAPIGTRIGVKVKDFYYPAQTDWASLATTIAASKPNAVDLYSSDADCIAAVPALRAAGYTGIIQMLACQSLQQRLSYSQLKNVYFGSPLYTPAFASAPAKAQSDLAIYARYMAKDVSEFGKAGFSNDQGEQGFFLAVQAADHLRQIKPSSGDAITAADVKAGMPSTKGPLFFRTGTYDCSKPTWPGTTGCATGIVFAQETSDGKLAALPNQPVDISAARPTS